VTNHNRRRAVWLTLLGVGTIYEIHEVRDHENGYPLTWVFRWVFRTDHPIGRVAFLCVFGWFCQWFVPHVLSEAVAAAVTAPTATDTRARAVRATWANAGATVAPTAGGRAWRR
jgi:hypothetical protein